MAKSEREALEGPSPRRRRAPAKSPEDREIELISMAFDYAEEQFREGTASSQMTVHFLSLASSREKKVQAKLESENELLRKRIADQDTAVQVKDLMDEALKAFRGYAGADEAEDDENYEEY